MWLGTNMLPRIHFLLLVLSVIVLWDISDACPPACTCTLRKQRDGDKSSKKDNLRVGRGRKVSCVQNLSPITSISQISSLPLDTVVLDLSKNAITLLEHGDFNRLSLLQKLDLSENQISRISSGAFEGLINLIKLDLSKNKLGSITSGMFDGMPKLEKLLLSDNRINTIPEGTFNNLLALKRIEFKSDYLRCDCHLQWIAKWAKDKNVKIPQSTTCAVPQELKGVQLKTLKKKDLHCDRPLELPLFEIYPKKSQVVFEGDKLPFECRASVIDKETRMVWLRKGEIVETNRSMGIFIHTVKSQDRSLMIHRLVLENLMKSDSGVWQCMVTTPQGNVSHSISIVVLSNLAPTCPLITSKTKKGVYKWPRTVAGVVSEQPCKRGKGKKATHKCTQDRKWEDLNVQQCEYIDEMTRKLQYMAATGLQNKHLNSSVISKTAKDLKAMVSDPEMMSDSTDFVLATQVVELVSSLVPVNEELSDTVLNIVSSLMNVNTRVLRQGQMTQQACTRLVNVVENIPRQLQGKVKVTKYSENIALEAMEQSIQNFQGMTCFAYFSNIFSCTDRIINQTISQENLQGSVQLPRTLFHNSTEVDEAPDEDKVDLQFILYKEPKLFPITATVHQDPLLGSKKVSVVSCILSANLSRVVTNLTDPIILTFKVKAASDHIYPVYWDFSANGGLGDWRTDGCEIVYRVNNITTVHCYHLSVFAILETSSSVTAEKVKMLHLMEAAVYVGSCLCIICLMAVIITYVSCFRFINVPKKMKHSVINISVSILLLIIGYTMGVKRTDHHLACQIVGISIHYLTLCAIFWITITSYNMLKKFTKADKPPAPPPEPVAMPLPPKPMLRFYLLGWGVPIIICGITAAVSIDHYAEPDYCFLAWDPSLGAFYGPVALLVVFNLVFFLRISCVIRGSTVNDLNESDQTEDVNDMEHQLDDTSTEIQALTRARESERNNDEESDSQSIASSIMDQEKRPKSQLYSIITILFLFIVFWVCGAFAVAEPFKSIIPRQELIFSYLYGFTCAIFGLFMLAYFCLSRKDSCSSWRRFFCCEQQPVYDLSFQGNNDVNLANGHAVRANGNIEQNNKKYNIPQDVTQNGYKESNINLVPTNTSSVIEESVDNSTAENAKVFYNPKQNGVAKKFWEKQRHNSRLITRDMTKDYNSSLTDFSGSEANRVHNNGNASDNKSHVSIEIQIQPKDLNNFHSNISRSPLPNVQYPNNTAAHSGPSGGMPVFSMLPLDRNQIPPVGGSGSPGATSPCCSTVSYCDSQAQSQNHPRSPSSCSLGSRSHPSAFTPVQPKNNTLPKQSKNNQNSNGNSPPSYFECMVRNGSVPRLRDFDGQSHVSDACQREQTSTGHGQNQSYPQPVPLANQDGCTYKQYGSVDDHITCEPVGSGYHFHRARSHSGGGYSSDASAKQRRKREHNFIHEVQQRIPCEHLAGRVKSPALPLQNTCSQPVNNKSFSPQFDKGKQQQMNKKLSTPDSDSGINYKRYRANDSDHNSEPASHSHVAHRRKNRSHDSHHRHSRHKNMPKQKSLDWERELNHKPKAIPYAYVNHNYTEKVRQKLQSQSSAEAKNYWGSPSMGEEEDSSSSTGDEECFDHNVWVLQNQRKQKKKKETSV